MTIKFVPTHSIKISVVGKCSTDQYHNQKPCAVFCKADLWLSCAQTKKKEFTLGADGILKIAMDNYKMFHNKNLILQTIKDDVRDVDEYIDSHTWRSLCDDHSFKFTDALVNRVFQKLSCYKVWIHQQWWVKEINGPTAEYTLMDVEPLVVNGKWKSEVPTDTADYIERYNAECTECGTKVYFSGLKLCKPSTFLCGPCATGEPI